MPSSSSLSVQDQLLTQALEAARTPEEGFALWGRAAGFDPALASTLTNEPWASALRTTVLPASSASPHLPAAVEWALARSAAWADRAQQFGLGHPERQSAWSDPAGLPACLLLVVYRWHVTPGSPAYDAATAERVAERVDVLKETGLGGMFDSWSHLGFRTTAQLAEWAHDADPEYGAAHWTHLALHPSADAGLITCGVRLFLDDVDNVRLMDRPGVMDDPTLRTEIWKLAMESDPFAMAVVARATPTEFSHEVMNAALNGEFEAVGLLLSRSSAEQRAALRLTKDQFAQWCEQVPPRHRPHLIGLAVGGANPASSVPRRR